MGDKDPRIQNRDIKISLFEELKLQEQKVTKEVTNRLIYCILRSDIFKGEIDSESPEVLEEYKDFITNKINEESYPKITKLEPHKPTIAFLKNEESQIGMRIIDTSKIDIEKEFLIVDLNDALLDSQLIKDDTLDKINNFMILTEVYLDSQDQGDK